ncbi:HAL/PAL/TAL family ammonia-lyase [Henriciella litoralis]|uniref:HAL/PAL/TAL family ammonia-lyase n=1 Tax=Henriciella litoralis TaxID=568102 RepID=UPI000A009739|nr:aromatic amino acid ammonia-lyase [Henriciella litoralis]
MADQVSDKAFVFGEDALAIDALVAISTRKLLTRLSDDKDALGRITRSAEHVRNMLDRDGKIYGVTTGYGDSVVQAVPASLVDELPLHLTRFHGCGMGRFLTPEETRAVLTVRLVTLALGWSGVSLELVERLADMLRLDILPLIPAEGSVGASGDLTPLSYIAGALVGERQVLHKGAEKSAADAFAEEGIAPIRLKPKEALALMNGTSVMSALTAIAMQQARRLSDAATRMTSMTCLAILGNPRHFDIRLFNAKPHQGQMQVAAQIREDLAPFAASHEASRMQDRYSVRCAPHVIGVLQDALPGLEAVLTTEINSANDNPLFDPETGDVLHGGHFYGGHACYVADTLKVQVANLADLMDRQLATLVDTRYSNGLPSNLSGATGERAAINHGFKAVQIAVSAWTAEACKLTMPASVFSRSTECHNQDKVSMGTIASRDALRVNTLVAQITAAHLMANAQAIEIRLRSGELTEDVVGDAIMSQIRAVREHSAFLEEDRPLDTELRSLTDAILTGSITLV